MHMVNIQKKDLGGTHVGVASGFLKLMLSFPGTEKIGTNMKDFCLLGTGIATAIYFQCFHFIKALCFIDCVTMKQMFPDIFFSCRVTKLRT